MKPSRNNMSDPVRPEFSFQAAAQRKAHRAGHQPPERVRYEVRPFYPLIGNERSEVPDGYDVWEITARTSVVVSPCDDEGQAIAECARLTKLNAELQEEDAQ